MQHLHQQGEAHQAAAGDQGAVGGDPRLGPGGHERRVLDALDQHEVDDRSRCDTPEQADRPLEPLPVAERKDQTGEPLHDHTEKEGNRHREEDAHDDRKGLLRIEVIGEVHAFGPGHLHQREGKRTAQQLEYHRYGGRGRQAQRVEHVEHEHVGDHHGQEDADKLLKEELLGTEDSVAGNLHHAVGHQRSAKNARGRDPHDHTVGRHLGADGRRKEIHRIVAHADHQVEDREQKEEQDDSEVDSFHDLFQLVAQRCPPGVSDRFPGC